MAWPEPEEEKLPERRKERGLSGPRRRREEGLGEDSVANSITEVECNDPEKSLWEFRQEVTEDFLKRYLASLRPWTFVDLGQNIKVLGSESSLYRALRKQITAAPAPPNH
ncbi:hypothetical protein PAL_GLEAN10013149 [Pteropus alecto]|uniref:Uncharacterized protein n=1 Tax=Pteropus alecto TaxID=9402 RepID=L5KHF1_PTEAL|nr:hypothetical protein PAL_GLEAN10013149 [Pteropus alecto]